MQQITSAQFKQAIELDPAWASKLTEPVEISDFCDMDGSLISHLSTQLHFTGQSIDGDVAKFGNCPNLKVAEGTFHGGVSFAWAGIEKIGELTITQANKNRTAAKFFTCENLKVAEGTFPGFVDFMSAGIEKIGDLTIAQPDGQGNAATFYGCKNLKVAEGNFPGFVSFAGSGIERIGKLTTLPAKHGNAADFRGCSSLQPLPQQWLIPEIIMDEILKQQSEEKILAENHAKKRIKAQPEIEI